MSLATLRDEMLRAPRTPHSNGASQDAQGVAGGIADQLAVPPRPLRTHRRYARHWEIIARLYEHEPQIELFDTAVAPDELTDVSAAHPDVVAKLSDHLRPAIESPYSYSE